MYSWEEITEEKARNMLAAIDDHLGDDELIETYTDALEKRFRKPTGTISDYIFQEDLSIEAIMERLLKDDTIDL